MFGGCWWCWAGRFFDPGSWHVLSLPMKYFVCGRHFGRRSSFFLFLKMGLQKSSDFEGFPMGFLGLSRVFYGFSRLFSRVFLDP